MSLYANSYEQPLLPPVIKNLLIANGMIFFFQMFFSGSSAELLMKYGALWPMGMDSYFQQLGYAGSEVGFYPWQVVTYGFLHGNFAHIFFNMLALWMFGREIEIEWGSKRFAIFYFTCLIGAGVLQLIVTSASFANTGQAYPTVGASGGTYGVLLAFGMMFPYRKIMLLIPPIPMEARWFVIIFGGLELFYGVTGMRTGIAHFAHLGGMAFGFLLIQFWRRKLPIKPKSAFHW